MNLISDQAICCLVLETLSNRERIIMKNCLKITSILLFITLFGLLISTSACAQSDNFPVRIINVVYDDSSSMIKTQNKLVDRWCRAKYSLEVFSAMLGQNDTMNVYYMSQFARVRNADPMLVLRGADGGAVNVGKIHDTITAAGSTPFTPVEKAYSDLEASKADEKWLVILTDGVFAGNVNLDGFFADKANDINVMFFSMGTDAASITPDQDTHIYFERAENSEQILSKITAICTRIFNNDKLNIDITSKQISFDVPMKELVVFAQGSSVVINGIRTSSGKLIKSTDSPVSIKYSTKAATNLNRQTVATDLNGSIAYFEYDFDTGDYTVDVSGAETIEVYYKPNVEVSAVLVNESGNEVTDKSKLRAGNYTIYFEFVKSGTDEKIGKSELLGDVTYDASVVNNGVANDNKISSGDIITIDEGNVSIDVTAHFLEYNTVSTHLDYTIFKDKSIGFSVVDNPEYNVLKNETIANMDSPIMVKVTIDGEDVTASQWNEMTLPEIETIKTSEPKLTDTRVVKSSQIGIYEIYPTFDYTEMLNSGNSSCAFNIVYDQTTDDETWFGTAEIALNYTIFQNQLVNFSLVDSPEYKALANGTIENEDQPLLIKVTYKGGALTDEQWQNMSVPVLTAEENSVSRIKSINVKKSSQTGIYEAYLTFDCPEMIALAAKTCNLQLTYDAPQGKDNWSSETKLTFSYLLYDRIKIDIANADDTKYSILTDGTIENTNDPTLIKVTINGKDLTDAQWSNMSLLAVEKNSSSSSKIESISIIKSSKPGIYELYFSFNKTAVLESINKNCTLDLAYEGVQGTEVWYGRSKADISFQDHRPWYIRNKALIIRILKISLVILLILGYIPPFKRYLPRKLKRSPLINGESQGAARHKTVTSHGRFSKKTLSTLLPYVSEKGTIKIAPNNVFGVPKLSVKATKASRMIITNSKDFVGKDYITFAGSAISKNDRKKKISASTMITISKEDMTYSCILTKSR